MTQSTNTIVPVLADSLGIPPYRIVMTGITGYGVGSSLSSGFPVGYIGVTGELGIEPSSIGDCIVAGVGYVRIGAGQLLPGSPIACDTLGQAVPVTAVGQRIVGFCLENTPTGPPGQICKILVCPGVY